jgi:hypothetical protein
MGISAGAAGPHRAVRRRGSDRRRARERGRAESDAALLCPPLPDFLPGPPAGGDPRPQRSAPAQHAGFFCRLFSKTSVKGEAEEGLRLAMASHFLWTTMAVARHRQNHKGFARWWSGARMGVELLLFGANPSSYRTKALGIYSQDTQESDRRVVLMDQDIKSSWTWSFKEKRSSWTFFR